MKVWIITSEYPGELTGGIARYVENIAGELAASGVDLTVITRAGTAYHRRVAEGFSLIGFTANYDRLACEQPETAAGRSEAYPYNCMGYWPALSYQIADLVESLIARQGPPDVIECQEYGALPYYLLQRKLIGSPSLQNIPIVVHCHSPYFMLTEANHQPSAEFPAYWIGEMEKFSIAAADALLCPSRYLADKIHLAAPCRDKVQVIPLPCRIPPETRDRQGVAPAKEIPRVLYFGRLEIRKGILRALKAMEALWLEGREFSLTLIGGDTEHAPRGTTVGKHIRSRYAHRIESGKLTLLDNLPFDELQQHLAASEIVIVPSLWENFPNTCIEAMAQARVVLASTSGGQAEVITPRDGSGFLFDWSVPDDLRSGLSRILDLPVEERRRIGAKARRRVLEMCAPETIVSRRLEHFEQVIRQHGKPAVFPVSWQGYTAPAGMKNGATGSGLSVIIPFYNLGKYVTDAVESALRSTRPAEEILIIDDGSTNREDLAILRGLEKRHTRVRVVRQPNSGLASARNTGAREARGEYIAFLDADDEVEPTFFEKSLRVLNEYANVGFVYSWVQFFGNSDAIWPTWNAHLPYLLGHNMLVPICVVRKAAFLEIGGNNPEFEYNYEDYECWINMMKHGWLGISLPECLVRYRVRTGSMLRSANDQQFRYLFDLLVRTHPELYQQWGPQLAQLQASNGSGIRWDHPGRDYVPPAEDYIRQVEKQRDAFWEEIQILGKAWTNHVNYIQDQQGEIERLRSNGHRTARVHGKPPVVNGNGHSPGNDYTEILKEQRHTLESRLAVASEMLSVQHAQTWEYEVGARIVRRLRGIAPVRFLLKQPLLLRTLEKIL